MTQLTWTEKHDAYCLQNRLTPTAKLIWQWLIHTERPEEAEPDLKQFNAWAAKHRGKPFHRDTLKKAWDDLIEADIIHPIKQFTWAIWRVVIRPINLLLYPISTPRKQSRFEENDRDSQPSNALVASDEVIAAAATDIKNDIRVVTCEEAGITYSNPSFLRKFSLGKVRAAIALFFERGGHGVDCDGLPHISNPRGFVRDALEKGWIDEQENVSVCRQYLEVSDE